MSPDSLQHSSGDPKFFHFGFVQFPDLLITESLVSTNDTASKLTKNERLVGLYVGTE